MLQSLKTKASAVVRKAVDAKNAVVFGSFMILVSGAHASQAQTSANKIGGFLTAVLAVLPTVSRIAGILAIIGGLWGLYKYYKSGGRDGSLPAGIAGLLVGVALFFLGGLLTFGADAVGIQATGALPMN
jgi:hypothetical protein